MSEQRTDSETEGIMGGLLKLANEAGGRIDRHRIERRPARSHVRQALEMATERGLVSLTGAITPSGYRWLGAWLNGDSGAVR